MNLGRSASRMSRWVAANASHDFCPWANEYIYWLKEPIGWFVLATLASVLTGVFLSPFGWTLAAGLVAVLALGLGFPLIAMAAIRCELKPVNTELSEGEASHLTLVVSNRLPIPVMGLMIEGYLAAPPLPGGEEWGDDGLDGRDECGLARVPGWSRASYRLPLCPQYRGRYPVNKPRIACSFPFGIYTARKHLQHVAPVIVRPMMLPLVSEVDWGGNKLAEVGHGQRASSHGDFLGVREFRRGDSLRSIHWVQSARTDSLIVCERGGPERSPIAVHLSTARCLGTGREARDNLAWRVRIVASLCDLLAARHIPFMLCIDGQQAVLAEGQRGVERVSDILADVPLDSPKPSEATSETPANTVGIFVHERLASGRCVDAQYVGLEIRTLRNEPIAPGLHFGYHLLDVSQDISTQLSMSLREMQGVNSAA